MLAISLLLILSVSKAKAAYYQFGYQVDTLDTGDYHGHMEQLDGQVKRGEFKVRLPDGRLQVTSYQADEKGFRPRISYEIDPLFVPPPPEVFTPEKKLVRRPPPRDYHEPDLKYLPPSIDYSPRGEPHHHHHELLTPQPTLSSAYLPPKPKAIAPPSRLPSQSYTVPELTHTSSDYGHDFTPLINYAPRSHSTPEENYVHNFLSQQQYHASSIERFDPNSEGENSPQGDQQQHYYLVPVRANTGSKPVLALLVKKREH